MSRIGAWARGLVERWNALFRKGRVEADLDEEIRFHLEREVRRNVEAGLAPGKARRRAYAEFGGVEQVKERHRDARGTRLLEDLVQDVGYALRVVRRRPGHAAVAVATIALAIGANTAIFSVVDAVLLRPLPYGDADRLVAVWPAEEADGAITTVSFPTYREWAEGGERLESLGAYSLSLYTVHGGREPVRSYALAVSSSLLPTLGIEPHLGRNFTPAADHPGGPKTALLGYGLWRRTFGGDSSVVGRTVRLGGEPFQVVGVLPRDFEFPPPFRVGQGMFSYSPEVWVPAGALGQRIDTSASLFFVVGRLAPGASPESATAELTAITSAIADRTPDENDAARVRVVGLHGLVVGHVRSALLMLAAAVGLVLLIACVNLGSLFLARLTVRDREVALRSALGAGRGRIVRQLLSESLVLAGFGGVLGVALAWAGIETLVAIAPPDVPRLGAVALNGRVLGFTIALSTATGLLFGVVPAVRAARGDLRTPLRTGSAGAGGSRSERRTRGALVAAEVALAVALLVGAGLLVRSFASLMDVDLGFETGNRVTVELLLPEMSYTDPADRVAYVDRLRTRLAALPGVSSVSGAHHLPLGGYYSRFPLRIEGRTPPTDGPPPTAQNKTILPDYFEAMGIPVLRGRPFDEGDGPDAPPVLVVNRALAERHWPDGDPIDARVSLYDRWHRIIGVVDDVRHHGATSEPEPTMYLPYAQYPTRVLTVVVRTALEPQALSTPVRREVRGIDPEIPVTAVQSLEALEGRHVAGERFNTLLMGGFAALGLALAAVGVYGVLAFAVARRTREFGVRMALGASARAVRRGVLRDALGMVGLGTAVGLAAAVPLARLLRGLLFGVEPGDPATFAAVGGTLTVVGLLAAWVPAHRATRVDPMTSLRDD